MPTASKKEIVLAVANKTGRPTAEVSAVCQSYLDQIVEELARRLDGKTGIQDLWPRFQSGDIVQVVAGALEGEGEVLEEAKTTTGKATILLEFMGRMVKAKVPWDALQFVEDRAVRKQRLPRRTRAASTTSVT